MTDADWRVITEARHVLGEWKHGFDNSRLTSALRDLEKAVVALDAEHQRQAAENRAWDEMRGVMFDASQARNRS